MDAVKERSFEIMKELSVTDTWELVRFKQGYIKAMEDLVTDPEFVDLTEETQ